MAGNLNGFAETESNFGQILGNMPPGFVFEFVNQLVITNTSSFRTSADSKSRVRRDLPKFKKPRLLIHSMWPSVKVTKGEQTIITSICSIEQARLTYCRPDRIVPREGRDSISLRAFDLIRNIWIPLVDGVTLGSYMNYCWFKHIRFHPLPSTSNVWDKTLTWAETVIGNTRDKIDGLMAHLETMGYQSGLIYFCSPFVYVVTRYFLDRFGVDVSVIFFTHEGVRYWKEIRLLLNADMSELVFFPPPCLPIVYKKDTFVFELVSDRVIQ